MSNDYVQKKCYCNPSLDKSSFLGTKSMQTSQYMKPLNRADSVTVEAEGEQKRRDEEKGEKENKDDVKVKKETIFRN